MFSSFYGLGTWQYMGLLLCFVLSAIAQAGVTSAYKKYGAISTQKNISGATLARRLLNDINCQETQINQISGTLSDNFNPAKNIVSLSGDVYSSSSVAALAVAAHECGHVAQYSQNYIPIKLRNIVLPVANIGSRSSFYLVLAGMFFSIPILINLGLIFFAFAILFRVATLPIEFNASSRAIKNLAQGEYLNQKELVGAKKVLSAAAMTYVLAALVSVFQFLRLLSMANSRRR